MDQELLEKGREYARLHHTSLNHMVRELIKDRVEQKSSLWLEEAFSIMDSMKISGPVKKWNREDLYRS